MKMEADEVLLEFIHAELVSYAYNKAVSSNESSKKVGAAQGFWFWTTLPTRRLCIGTLL